MGAGAEPAIVPRLAYTFSAESDLRDIYFYLREQSGSRAIASSFMSRLKAHCETLAASIGTLGVARPELRSDVRFVPFGNYSIFFRYRDSVLEIINILESHRDVGAYFRERE